MSIGKNILMKRDDLREFENIIILIEQLDRTITVYQIQKGQAPVAYTYLYELCILRLLELFKANPEFIKGVGEVTDKAVIMLLKLIKESSPQDTKIMNELKKVKELANEANIKIPDTVNEFLKQFPKNKCTVNPKTQDPMDKLIDDYLKKKKKQKREKDNGKA
jgi:hypothetical protein